MRFLLTNFLAIAVAVAGWQAGLLAWLTDLPQTTWLMIGALAAGWCAGMIFAVASRWAAVFHVANALPMAGLVMTGIGIQLAGHGISQMTPDSAFVLFRGILESMSTTFIALVFMMHLRELAFWMAAEHI